MKSPSHRVTTASLALAFGVGALLHPHTGRADEWDQYYNAERSAKDLLYSYEDFKKMEKKEIEALVKAMCDADEDERKEVSSNIQSRARDKVRSEYDKVERRKNEALEMLKNVIGDDRFKSKRSDAERLKSDVEDKWKAVDKMWDLMRGSNHPVVSFMLDKGKAEHDYRRGRCSASEVDTGNGNADCIGYDGNACLIVEFKPNNTRAINKGWKQLDGYQKGLLNNPSKRQDLDKRSSSFPTCPKQFDIRVDCYTLCPEIDDDGNFKSTSTSWSTNCR